MDPGLPVAVELEDDDGDKGDVVMVEGIWVSVYGKVAQLIEIDFAPLEVMQCG